MTENDVKKAITQITQTPQNKIENKQLLRV